MLACPRKIFLNTSTQVSWNILSLKIRVDRPSVMLSLGYILDIALGDWPVELFKSLYFLPSSRHYKCSGLIYTSYPMAYSPSVCDGGKGTACCSPLSPSVRQSSLYYVISKDNLSEYSWGSDTQECCSPCHLAELLRIMILFSISKTDNKQQCFNCNLMIDDGSNISNDLPSCLLLGK